MKYIALDVGNVLVSVNFNVFLTKLSKQLNITMEDASYFFNRVQKLHDVGYTRLADELKDHFKIKSEVVIDELLTHWGEVIGRADYMMDFLEPIVKGWDLQIALLSNVGIEHTIRMKEELNGYPNNGFFDNAVKFFSCEVGVRKPSLLYYQTFLQLYPEWRNCGYVDDLQCNLDAAAKFGFRTFRFALDEITGDNFDQQKYDQKMQDLYRFIVDC
jgi:FMN phosphatase YigB (HAD superfamily)